MEEKNMSIDNHVSRITNLESIIKKYEIEKEKWGETIVIRKIPSHTRKAAKRLQKVRGKPEKAASPVEGIPRKAKP